MQCGEKDKQRKGDKPRLILNQNGYGGRAIGTVVCFGASDSNQGVISEVHPKEIVRGHPEVIPEGIEGEEEELPPLVMGLKNSSLNQVD